MQIRDRIDEADKTAQLVAHLIDIYPAEATFQQLGQVVGHKAQQRIRDARREGWDIRTRMSGKVSRYRLASLDRRPALAAAKTADVGVRVVLRGDGSVEVRPYSDCTDPEGSSELAEHLRPHVAAWLAGRG
ncbi:MAG: hypothetical protein H6733_10140 [Alphaproteobacteria bacterium]|nr:hypothetical protein [Alphaproteobacteria bacterium]